MAAVLLLLLNLPEPVSTGIKGSLREALAPLHEALSGTALRFQEASSTLRGFGGLIGENRRMAEDLIRLREEVRRLKALQEENDQLRGVLGFVRSSPRRLISAEIIARDVSGWWQTVRLNRGSRAGVEKGFAVRTEDGLIGRTCDVSANTTEVLLISDPSCRVSVRLPRTQAFGILVGTGVSPGGQVLCRLELIDRNLQIRSGDEVITSGLGGVFAEDIPVGYVDSVQKTASGLTQNAWVLPHTDLATMKVVFVTRSNNEPVLEGDDSP